MLKLHVLRAQFGLNLLRRRRQRIGARGARFGGGQNACAIVHVGIGVADLARRDLRLRVDDPRLNALILVEQHRRVIERSDPVEHGL
jgi:hypothetical protein